VNRHIYKTVSDVLMAQPRSIMGKIMAISGLKSISGFSFQHFGIHDGGRPAS
jgi:hypothetical protein